MTRWIPTNRAARRAANALLKLSRGPAKPAGWPPDADVVCVLACTHRTLNVGIRCTIGQLWCSFGARALAEHEAPEIASELQMQLSA